MRSPSEMDILQVDIGNKCFLRCSNCTRAISHQSKYWEMDIPTFERAIKSLEGWNRPGRIVGIISGEPTLNSNFEELSWKFAELWGGPLTKNAIHPIRDFNAWAMERLFDRSNGRGLWTSFGAGFYKHFQTIASVYSHLNPNDHSQCGRHQAMFITRKEYCEATGMSDEQWEENTRNCFVQNLWSGTTNDKGSYPCEVMAVIDRLYFDGSHAWPTEPGWWQRKPEDFGSMLDLCNYCSLAQPGPSQVDSADRDQLSQLSVDRLREAGSPAVKYEKYDLVTPEMIKESRLVTTRDSYVSESGIRVSPLNTSIRPQKVTLVVVCVGRSAHLTKTLLHNLLLVDEGIVVTDNADRLQRDISDDYSHLGFRIITADPHANGHAFNKGAMLNAGLAQIKNPDWIILSDADVFLSHDLRRFTKSHTLNPGVLYGVKRFDIPMRQQDEMIEAFLEQGTWFSGLTQSDPAVDNDINGFFMMFNRRAAAIRDKWPKVLSEEFCSAGGVDTHFVNQFPPEKRLILGGLAVAHIAHGPFGDGWNGSGGQGGDHLTWKQYGMMTTEGKMVKITDLPLPCKLRFVSTENEKVAEVEVRSAADAIPEEIVSVRGGRLYFLGEEAGSHLHVSYKEM